MILFRKPKKEQRKEENKQRDADLKLKKKQPQVKAVRKAASKLSYLPESLTKVLVNPHITEKSTDLAEKNKYIFKVSRQANKTEIKRAIEGLYGVRVQKVNVINIPAKKRRLGGIEGFRQGYRKAIVSLHPDDKIEIIPK